MKLEEKINILKKYGYIELTDEYLENVKAGGLQRTYFTINFTINNLKKEGKEAKLIHYFNDSFCIYSDKFIQEKTIEEILKGTIWLL